MAHLIETLAVRTREDVAQELGLHPNTVRKIETVALSKLRSSYPWLRELLEDEVGYDYRDTLYQSLQTIE